MAGGGVATGGEDTTGSGDTTGGGCVVGGGVCVVVGVDELPLRGDDLELELWKGHRFRNGLGDLGGS